MLIEKIITWKESLFGFLKNTSDFKFYAFITLVCTVTTVCCYFPDLDLYAHNQDFYERVNKQIENPLDPKTYQAEGGIRPNNHFNKRAFRLTVPLFAKVFSLTSQQVFCLQFLCLPVFFLILAKIFFNITSSRVISSLLTYSFCFLYPSKSFLFYMPVYDCFAYLMLAALFLSSNALLTFILVFLISFTDERALIASVFVLIFKSGLSGSFADLKERKTIISVLAGFGGLTVALFLRWWLAQNFNLGITLSSENGVGLGMLRNNMGIAPFALLQSLEGWWIVFILFLYFSIKQNQYLLLLSYGLALLTLFFAALCVGDITRSASYVFVCIFPIVAYLSQFRNYHQERIAWAVFLGCAFIPTYLIWGGETIGVYWLSPILPKALKFIL